MTDRIEQSATRGALPWRKIGWGGAAILLALPFVAGAPWTTLDYVALGVLLALVGGGIELAMRMSRNRSYRAGAAVAVAAAFLLIWINLAVGIFGDEENDANMMFPAVVLFAILAASAARGKARGMAAAMRATAVAQVSVVAIGLAGGFASQGTKGFFEAGVAAILFGTLWLGSAALFARAARIPA